MKNVNKNVGLGPKSLLSSAYTHEVFLSATEHRFKADVWVWVLHALTRSGGFPLSVQVVWSDRGGWWFMAGSFTSTSRCLNRVYCCLCVCRQTEASSQCDCTMTGSGHCADTRQRNSLDWRAHTQEYTHSNSTQAQGTIKYYWKLQYIYDWTMSCNWYPDVSFSRFGILNRTSCVTSHTESAHTNIRVNLSSYMFIITCDKLTDEKKYQLKWNFSHVKSFFSLTKHVCSAAFSRGHGLPQHTPMM